jgi:hypothetical protein
MLNKLALSASVLVLAGSLAVAPSGRSMAAQSSLSTMHWLASDIYKADVSTRHGQAHLVPAAAAPCGRLCALQVRTPSSSREESRAQIRRFNHRIRGSDHARTGSDSE